MATLPAPEDRILSVGELTLAIKEMLAGAFPGQWVKGEISGYRGPQPSGHLYFKLKDAEAQLDCAMFKMNAMRLAFTPKARRSARSASTRRAATTSSSSSRCASPASARCWRSWKS
jgi:hypothetical protein